MSQYFIHLTLKHTYSHTVLQYSMIIFFIEHSNHQGQKKITMSLNFSFTLKPSYYKYELIFMYIKYSLTRAKLKMHPDIFLC